MTLLQSIDALIGMEVKAIYCDEVFTWTETVKVTKPLLRIMAGLDQADDDTPSRLELGTIIVWMKARDSQPC